ncbi:hypothetical protein MG290_11150 [Flavobacterium sp. CBA20B-1]|uniref:hypothetical protein n=1 Tax=unclassified Flavobacterium TaxID=196869 RepID=UPI002223F294|nr:MULTISPECIES: hypothetical protein [unclassified Flavobacterium]WCM41502.1 hypothetical protein MG290_11150 [Flavobacterium sp. CBA20B-1]
MKKITSHLLLFGVSLLCPAILIVGNYYITGSEKSAQKEITVPLKIDSLKNNTHRIVNETPVEK